MIMTGTVDNIRSTYLDFLYSLKWMEALGPFKIFVSLAIVGIIAYGISKISEMYERGLIEEKANKTGEDIGFMSAMGNILRKSKSS